MTHEIREAGHPADRMDVIDAFVDREPVDMDALLAALSSVDGRERLRGALELRALFAESPVSTAGAAPLARPARRAFALFAAAATVALVAGYAGFALANHKTFGSRSSLTSSIAADDSAIAAPTPTTIIPLDRESGWKDQTGVMQ